MDVLQVRPEDLDNPEISGSRVFNLVAALGKLRRMPRRRDDLRASALRPHAEVQALKAATHAVSLDRRQRAADSVAELLRSRTDRTEDLLHHVEVQALLARVEHRRTRGAWEEALPDPVRDGAMAESS